MAYKTPWISIWFNPRATLRSLLATDPKRSLWWLSSIFGFTELLNFFQSLALGLWLNGWTILCLALLLAPWIGYALMAMWSWLLLHIGRWLKGKGDFSSIRTAYAWSCVPLLGTLPIWLLIFIFFGERLFINFPQEPSLNLLGSSTLFLLLTGKLLFVTWALVLYFIGLSEVHRFSVMRSICTIAIAGIIVSLISGCFWFGLFMLTQP